MLGEEINLNAFMELRIHNNVSRSVMRMYNDYVVRAKEEEKKRAEESRLKREKEEAEWKDVHWNMASFAYSSPSYPRPWSTDYYKNNACSSIYFYEWGDITRKPIFFDCCLDFYEFLDKCGIRLTQEQGYKIKPQYGTPKPKELHFTCREGCKELIVKETYNELSSLVSANKVLGSMYS